MEQVNGLGGAFLRARDPARLRHWYADQLGARAVAEFDGLTLFAATPAEQGPANTWTLSFLVTDLDAMVDQLRAGGATVDVDPAERPEGRFAQLRDPEDNLIQLVEPPSVQRIHSAEPTAVRVLDDEEPTTTARHTGWRRWGPWLPLLLVMVLAVVFLATREDDTTAQPPRPSPTPSRGTTSATESDAITVRDVGERVFGVTAGWELLAHGPDSVVRIELAEGRITITDIPQLRSSGPASLIAGPDWVMVRPLDDVPGYLVHDGEPARELQGELGVGYVFPGPRSGEVWVGHGHAGSGDTTVLWRRALSGKRVGTPIRLPPTVSPPITSDGAGYVLASSAGGTYVARPDGLRRVTTGQVDAVGPNHLLATECDERARCGHVVINRGTGKRRPLGGTVDTTTWPRGTIAPDGSVAAVVRDDVGNRPILSIIDLDTGQERTLGVSVRGGFAQSGVEFSPDSEWLFAIATSGALVAIDTETFQTRSNPFRLPSLSRLTIRPAN
ncbi:VOC family protein [Haloechinothrix salitolerans]|uniref:VOC family protein n=1 Tax=Haloechinothrix salitolerans TaxID=926830 RepID=A0ABW2C0R7_9PSEU